MLAVFLFLLVAVAQGPTPTRAEIQNEVDMLVEADTLQNQIEADMDFDRKKKPGKKQKPSKKPSKKPAKKPSKKPGKKPTKPATGSGSGSGTVSKPATPSKKPSKKPGKKPGKRPKKKPGKKPGKKPSKKPSGKPVSSKAPTTTATPTPTTTPTTTPRTTTATTTSTSTTTTTTPRTTTATTTSTSTTTTAAPVTAAPTVTEVTTTNGPCLVKSGPGQGKPCVFPFYWNYDKETYDGCAYDPSRDVAPWCSTKTVNGVHQAGQGEWGQCDDHCPLKTGVTLNPPTTPPPTVAPGIAAGCVCGKKKKNTRIISGQATEINEYPWMAGVGSMGSISPSCGGALISDQYVMTAAHCCDGKAASTMQVFLGDHDWSINTETNSTRWPISKVIVHPNYGKGGSLNKDICLLKMERPISFPAHPHVRPVCLPPVVLPAKTANQYVNYPAIVAGWGKQGGGKGISKYLQEINVRVWANSACQGVFGRGLTNQMMCISKTTNPMDATCNGDSGSAVFTKDGENYEQIGIVSWGVKGCENNAPSVMARVTAFAKWIKDTTQDSNYCPRQ